MGENTAKKTIYSHLWLWAIYGLALFLFYCLFLDVQAALGHALSFMAIQWVSFYLNLLIFLPKYYQKFKYLQFISINIIVVFGSSLGHTFYENFKEGRTQYLTLESILAHALPSLIAVFAAFLLYTYIKRKQQAQKELAILKAEKNFLVQQINPHFLFNTLNNIYSLTIDNNPKGSAALLQLSRMLDYSLYGNRQEVVAINQEIEYINNFIALFKLKDEEIQNIQFEYDLVDPQCPIAPMLLLPFVENAFKHGTIETIETGYINIKLQQRDSTLIFSCQNSYFLNKTVDNTGGIGIANVSRRLELLYPERHHLQITTEDNSFKVDLKIETHDL